MMAARRPLAKASPQGSDERSLVEAAQRDPARFEAVYELHFERVYAFVVSRVHDRVTAEDLTADVFHKALANLPKYEWRGAPLAAWLFRIATNAISDQYKRARYETPALNDPPEIASEPDLRVIEYRARLFQLVRQLPEVQRRVIQGRFIEQRSIREIAQQLGKSEGAIKQLQFRALESLRAEMGGGHA
jgi:RNA polymerase sigma-70 factor (ECF subfamily)